MAFNPSPAVTPSLSGSGLGSTINSTAATNPTGSLYFPSDLGKSDAFNYWMSFSFYAYSMPSSVGSSPQLSDLGTIRLPLPNQMIDQQDVTYDQASLSLAAGMGINGALNGGVGSAIDSTIGGLLGQGAVNIGNKVISGLGGGPNDLAAGLAALTGTAVNPFMTVLFKQPAFKKHQFSWRMAPANENETYILNQIINTFRYNQLPDVASFGSGALLTYPNIVQITISNNDPNIFTYSFKPAVIDSLTINFAPSGQPSFFGSTQAPTDVDMRLSLLEIEFWLQRDYGTPNATGTSPFSGVVGPQGPQLPNTPGSQGPGTLQPGVQGAPNFPIYGSQG